MDPKNLLATTFLVAASITFTAPHFAAAHAEPLPRQRDIPEDLSTVICPDPASANRLLEDYYRVDDAGIFDTSHFFDGLEEMGCRQGSGPLAMEEVLSRKSLREGKAGSYVAYRGRRADGSAVFGIVDEVVNDMHPRTAFGQWMALHAPSGRLVNHPGGGKLYLCRSPDAARQAVRAIPPVREQGAANPHQNRARDPAFAANGCVLARGEFRITAVGTSAFISTGPEVGEDWTALDAIDDQGRAIGLVYDAAVM